MQPYQAVSCELHSQYELYIMRAHPVIVSYRDQHGRTQSLQAKAIDLVTQQGAEWLRLKTDAGECDIRLDQIILCKPAST